MILSARVPELQDPVLTAGFVKGGEPQVRGVAEHPRGEEVGVAVPDPGHLQSDSQIKSAHFMAKKVHSAPKKFPDKTSRHYPLMGAHGLNGNFRYFFFLLPYRQIAQIFYGAGDIRCFPRDADDSFARELHEVRPRQRTRGVGSDVVVELAQVIARPPGGAS